MLTLTMTLFLLTTSKIGKESWLFLSLSFLVGILKNGFQDLSFCVSIWLYLAHHPCLPHYSYLALCPKASFFTSTVLLSASVMHIYNICNYFILYD